MSPITTELEPVRGPQGPLGLFATVVQLAVLQRYPEAGGVQVAFESPRRPEYGDFATNVAFSLAKIARRSPQDVATQIVADVRAHAEFGPMVADAFSSI